MRMTKLPEEALKAVEIDPEPIDPAHLSDVLEALAQAGNLRVTSRSKQRFAASMLESLIIRWPHGRRRDHHRADCMRGSLADIAADIPAPTSPRSRPRKRCAA